MEKTKNFKLINGFNKYSVYFIFYGVVGWIIEVIVCLFKYHTFINRGFLHLPILPIYSFGAIIISCIFKHKEYEIFKIAIIGGLVCTALEYITSLFLDKVFNIVLWDYKELPFNINGRISLFTSVLFMVASIVVVKILNPMLNKVVKKYRKYKAVTITLLVLIVIVVVDFIYTIICDFLL